ncbi:MAG: CDP-glycerol glycerophosphotransferase family protein [Acetobacter sp.]|nr:CDP-glycerol glycerophosphotransferase family protein [Bacteroides sp.]MCM1341558.1 CDP-glycerol glycerophosphotransferase family protein [Acetobacter sp.]MCM1433635.1 CDP-glycerol glycerophosphotransferase family protein [Clostridiales bacterium]
MIYKIINMIFCVYKKIFYTFIGLKNIILFESEPAFSDNALYVFDEMLKRGMNKKYKLVWMLNNKNDVDKNIFSDIENVKVVYRKGSRGKYYYSYAAKIILSSNAFLPQKSEKQQSIYLAHGAAFKNTRGKYTLPNSYINPKVVSISKFLAKYDAVNLECDEKCMLPLGFPRNDLLISGKVDLNKLFNKENCKFICWMPTYRQHNLDRTHICSSVEMPILHSNREAEIINAAAKAKKVVLLVKPHPAQDLSHISTDDLSNIIFIDNDYLKSISLENYSMLGSCDALITDYSSVYYDFLLTDKPVGLCWEDFDEYNKNEGFTVDPNVIMKPCEKILNCDDMINFISHVADGIDVYKEERNVICNMVHDYVDCNSTERVVDYIINLKL